MNTTARIRIDNAQAHTFQSKVLAWFDQYGRKDLPWQSDITPYRVWVSEIMLQQTQVTTVIPYYQKFMQHFPDVNTLSEASQDAVLHLWSGLGYYARARNLHKAAQIIAAGDHFPDSLESLTQLPGIGLSTAGAILSIAFNNSHPILDGNVKRVLCRYHGIVGWPGLSEINKLLWQISESYTPAERIADYTQAIMDLGATLCTRTTPQCLICPIQSDCRARLQNQVTNLPTRKTSKKIPSKHCIFLLLLSSDQQVLLEQRPAAGIWGGLWSLPEFDSVSSAIEWCREKNMTATEQQVLAPQRHTFSHFHLDYTTLIIRTDNPIDNVMEANHSVWYKARQVEHLALAVPIKRLLENLF